MPLDGEDDGVVNTVYCLNVKTRTVELLRQENNEFRPRMAHTGVKFKDKVFLFGGLEKGKIFNSQFLRMTVKSADGEKLSDTCKESKSIKPEGKELTHCKFCPVRSNTKPSLQTNPLFSKREFPDYSALEGKLKRRMT